MTRRVEIDEEVFALLKGHADPLEDTVNDVLRRLLLPEEAAGSPGRRSGNLVALVEAGLVRAGDRLTHHRKRSGQTFHAVVTADGWTELPDGRAFPGPSPALRAYVHTEINGNKNWTHERSGKTLRELLDTLRP